MRVMTLSGSMVSVGAPAGAVVAVTPGTGEVALVASRVGGDDELFWGPVIEEEADGGGYGGVGNRACRLTGQKKKYDQGAEKF